ncbi:MAG: non-hydrolyzing UDP-N-acetylglucosamine 2-epimerase [Promethearchaeota archaeon]
MAYRLLFIFGTRPEAIKLAPLINQFKKQKSKYAVSVCVTAQHREMLDQVLIFFNIQADYDLNLMQPNQSLFDVTAKGLKGLEKVLEDCKPDLIFVQGDTTTTFIGALAGFYKKIKIVHIEAGLRSGKKYSPFPEEKNRTLTGHLADFHFPPTEKTKQNLINEGIKENIWVVGNTVIEAMFLTLKKIKDDLEIEKKINNNFKFIKDSSKVILVTSHRRESFGKPFENICYALKEIAEQRQDVQIVYPVHLNPNVRKPVNKILNHVKNVHLIDPLDYIELIWLMNRAHLILTDSGGIQEEAPSLGKPVLVLREVTERTEGIDAGTAKIVGTDKEKIVDQTIKLLTRTEEYNKMAKVINPYGDGKTSIKIINYIEKIINSSK